MTTTLKFGHPETVALPYEAAVAAPRHAQAPAMAGRRDLTPLAAEGRKPLHRALNAVKAKENR